jgi:hypothetical protein
MRNYLDGLHFGVSIRAPDGAPIRPESVAGEKVKLFPPSAPPPAAPPPQPGFSRSYPWWPLSVVCRQPSAGSPPAQAHSSKLGGAYTPQLPALCTPSPHPVLGNRLGLKPPRPVTSQGQFPPSPKWANSTFLQHMEGRRRHPVDKNPSPPPMSGALNPASSFHLSKVRSPPQ